MATQPAVINKREDVLKKIGEIYPLLLNEDKKIAESLHELALEWNLKIGIMHIRNNSNNTETKLDVVYSAKKPFVRSIFMFKIHVDNIKGNAALKVKHKFSNIDVYRAIVEACPNNIKDLIKNIKTCTKCHPACKQERVFTLDGVKYNSCPAGTKSYENLTSDEWNIIRNLVIEEYKAHSAL